jgi:hypothetical protein
VFSVAKKKNSVNQRETVSKKLCGLCGESPWLLLKKALGPTPHPKASPAPSNKALNAKANFIMEFIRNCLFSQE